MTAGHAGLTLGSSEVRPPALYIRRVTHPRQPRPTSAAAHHTYNAAGRDSAVPDHRCVTGISLAWSPGVVCCAAAGFAGYMVFQTLTGLAPFEIEDPCVDLDSSFSDLDSNKCSWYNSDATVDLTLMETTTSGAYEIRTSGRCGVTTSVFSAEECTQAAQYLTATMPTNAPTRPPTAGPSRATFSQSFSPTSSPAAPTASPTSSRPAPAFCYFENGVAQFREVAYPYVPSDSSHGDCSPFKSCICATAMDPNRDPPKAQYCGLFDDLDFSSGESCCICGGGGDEGNEYVTYSMLGKSRILSSPASESRGRRYPTHLKPGGAQLLDTIELILLRICLNVDTFAHLFDWFMQPCCRSGSCASAFAAEPGSSTRSRSPGCGRSPYSLYERSIWAPTGTSTTRLRTT